MKIHPLLRNFKYRSPSLPLSPFTRATYIRELEDKFTIPARDMTDEQLSRVRAVIRRLLLTIYT